MRRREFITLLGGAAAWPLVARAQHSGKPTSASWAPARRPRRANGPLPSCSGCASSAGWRVKILRSNTVGLRATRNGCRSSPRVLCGSTWMSFSRTTRHPCWRQKQATATIAIVFAKSGDPVGAGIVASLARPGGNITGLSSQAPDAAGKRLELLRELIPSLRSVAALADVDNPYAALDVRELSVAARSLGVEVTAIEIRQAREIAPALEALKGTIQALYVVPVPLLFANRVRINTLALGMRVATMHGVREYVETGGLMSYGPNWPDMWRRSANFVDKICAAPSRRTCRWSSPLNSTWSSIRSLRKR